MQELERFEQDRQGSHLADPQPVQQRLRAGVADKVSAQLYWDEGADGLYFFNFYSMSAEWKRAVVGELVDPAACGQRVGRGQKDGQQDADDTGKAVLTDAASAETLAKATWAEATGFYRAVLVVGDGGE